MSDITCPSGLKLEVRGMKGKELRFFNDAASQKNGTFVDRILGVCVENVIDAGPYKIDGALKWEDILLGDKFYTLLQVRIATYGDDFEFSVQCPDCRRKIEWELKLSDLPVKRLSKEDLAAFTTGHPFHTTFPSDGRQIKFRLATGKDEKMAAKAKDADDALLKLTALRILDLGGETDRHKIQTFLEECSLADLRKLVKEFDKRDCGVDTDVEVECPKCLATKETNLPLGREFWFPK